MMSRPSTSEGQTSRGYQNKQLARFTLALWGVRYEIARRVTQYPAIFFPLARLLRHFGKLRVETVSSRTQLLIQGYPRSANTFATHAFRIAQTTPVVLTHHLHAPAQVIWAAQNKIPTLVLIRRPKDAVLSMVIFQPELSIARALRSYIRFYASIKPYCGQYVIATFDQATSDFGGAIKTVNLKFGTRFTPFVHTEENVNEVFKLIDQDELQNSRRSIVTQTRVARPSKERERTKTLLYEELQMERVGNLLQSAEALYTELVATSELISTPEIR